MKFIQERYGDTVSEVQLQGLEDGSAGAEDLPKNFSDVKKMFKQKEEGASAQITPADILKTPEYGRVSKQLKELQGQQREFQQLLESDQDPEDVIDKLRSFFGNGAPNSNQFGGVARVSEEAAPQRSSVVRRVTEEEYRGKLGELRRKSTAVG